ncbi:ABC transporter substrate-binding protein [Kineococcus rhizosphaerae]|uniref:Carbohydrate ABC transporter substrate-binding protein (CUT1 family) n=1 Tax=Kineococcus rhizosphaerae TaxID=559628 RepID=A0A2T0R0J4_9ACTN|nr:sugar ABC transporter substrate-binding protein [Kineococcus rhizosphaerae]PRY12855.1 carbohydrate ABC transporter substrate-binding protein (CUT1 family) [Kineococcus rhizosphaerae]
MSVQFPKGLSRRSLLSYAGGAGALAALAACGGNSGGSSSSGGDGDLTWFMWSGSTAEVDAWKHVAEMVTKADSTTKVTFQTAAWNDYWTKLTSQAASGASADLVGMQSLRAPQFAELLVPLDDKLSSLGIADDTFESSIYDGLKVDGKVVALPYDFGPYMIFYNKTAFQAAGLPLPAQGWTTADFMTAAKALTTDGKYGYFASSSIDGVLPWVLSETGKAAVDDSGKLDVDNDDWRKVLTWYRGLVSTEKVAAPLPSATSSAAATNQFQSGNAMMCIDGPWSLINAKATAKFEVGIAPMPAGSSGSKTMTAGSGFGVSKSAKDPDRAAKAVAVLTGTDAESYLGQQGRAFPARVAQQQSWYDGNDLGDAKTVMDYSIENSIPYKTTATWTQVNDTYSRYAVPAFNGDGSVDDLLTRVQAQDKSK